MSDSGGKAEVGASLEPYNPDARATGWLGRWYDKLDVFNARVNASPVGKFFQLEERGSTFTQEMRAGLVCFLTVCYIIPVNSSILADSGGTCNPSVNCNAERFQIMGDACKFDDPVTNPEWADCIFQLKLQLISATCIASMIGTLLMAFVANFPVAIAPAMGVNAYFTYTVVGFMGTGRISYEAALAAAFVEGLIFVFLTVVGLRAVFMELIPRNLLYATAAGIGCFLAFIGLQKSEGLGIITYDGATLVTLGGCLPADRQHMYTMPDDAQYWHDLCWQAWRDDDKSNTLTCGTCTKAYNYLINEVGLTVPVNLVEACQQYIFSFAPDGNIAPAVQLGLPPRSANYFCGNPSKMRSATMWLGIMGGALMVLLMVRKINAAILVGILFVTFISWIPTESNAASYFSDNSEIGGGAGRFAYFKKGATVPNVSMTGGKLDFNALSQGETWTALITFLYLDFMDATSTMFAMASMLNEKIPGFLDARGSWPRQTLTMVVDGVSIVVGSTLGTSPLTVFAESGVGIREGGRTGLTSTVIAFGFGISMFLSPIFASIPPYATGPAIFVVGALMFEHARHIDWLDVRSAVPAFMTIILMPLTFSIAYGIIAGIAAQILLWVLCFALEACDSLFKRPGALTMRQMWLNNTDMFYRVFRKEHILIDELPGYKPRTTFSDTNEGDLFPDNPAHVAYAGPGTNKPVVRAGSDDPSSSSDVVADAKASQM
ncbi:hypothetical protein FOA52_009294 [Chlamydomonas sp. UWO 241]|nr:hypothetical protein FOA52_009294 [Chlamydomonas sp. UWO 241]